MEECKECEKIKHCQECGEMIFIEDSSYVHDKDLGFFCDNECLTNELKKQLKKQRSDK